MPQIPSGYRPFIVTSPTNTYCRRNYISQLGGDITTIKNGIKRHVDEQRRDVTSLMKDVIRRSSQLDGITECDDSFKITHPIVIESLCKEHYKPVELRQSAREHLIKDLTALGYELALLLPDPHKFLAIDKDFIPTAKAAGISDGKMIFLDSKEPTPYVCFARDLFTQFGKRLFLTPQYSPENAEGLSNWAKGLSIELSTAGHGGECVIGDSFAFLCPNYLPPETSDFTGIPQDVLDMLIAQDIAMKSSVLRMCGIGINIVPNGWSSAPPPQILDDIGIKKRVLIPTDHADMSLLYLPRENALFTLESYYLENKNLLDRIVEEVRPDLFDTLPDEDGMPANSLPLPDGGVFMDKAASGSINKLRGLGIRVETTSRPFGEWAWGSGGGIHCATNEIWLPEQES